VEVLDDTGDVVVTDRLSIGATGSAGVEAVGQKLQGAHTVMAEGGQQTKSVGTVGADALGDTLADMVAIRQQIVEYIDDRGAYVSVFAQRQGQ
jgi:hypothetical protein